MRWLTRAAVVGDLEEPDWPAYIAHLEAIKPLLPAAFAAISEVSLHDGLIEKLTINESKRTVTLRLVIGDLQRGYQRARIKYREATLTTLGADLRWLVEYESTELVADEIDVSPNGFEHRLLFWPAGEIHIAFAAVDLDLHELPDRSRRGPRLRWRIAAPLRGAPARRGAP